MDTSTDPVAVFEVEVLSARSTPASDPSKLTVLHHVRAANEDDAVTRVLAKHPGAMAGKVNRLRELEAHEITDTLAERLRPEPMGEPTISSRGDA
jgi:hypothetical protein